VFQKKKEEKKVKIMQYLFALQQQVDKGFLVDQFYSYQI
jgi:hypothetical protein